MALQPSMRKHQYHRRGIAYQRHQRIISKRVAAASSAAAAAALASA